MSVISSLKGFCFIILYKISNNTSILNEEKITGLFGSKVSFGCSCRTFVLSVSECCGLGRFCLGRKCGSASEKLKEQP